MRTTLRTTLLAIAVLLLGSALLPTPAHAMQGAGGVVARPDSFYVYAGTTDQIFIPDPGILANDDGFDPAKHCIRRFDFNVEQDHDTLRDQNSDYGGQVRFGGGTCTRGTVRYKPPSADFVLQDRSRYCISERPNLGTCVTDIVDVTFTFARLDLGATDDGYEVNTYRNLEVGTPGVLGNDLYPYAKPDVHPVVVKPPPAGTSVDLRQDGSFTFAAGSYSGLAQFDYCRADTTATCVSPTARVSIQVRPSNTPVVHNDHFYILPEQPSTMCPGCGYNEEVPAASEWLIKKPPQYGKITGDNLAGVPFTFTPDDGFSGDDSFTYCVSDTVFLNSCASNVATVWVHVVGTPKRPPVQPPAGTPHPLDDEFATWINTRVAHPSDGLLKNDTVEQATTVVLRQTPEHGVVDLRSDGSFSYDPHHGFTGVDGFSYCLHEATVAPPGPKLRSTSSRASLVATGVGSSGDAAPGEADAPCTGRPARVRLVVNEGAPPTIPEVLALVDDAYQTPFETPISVEPAGVLINDSIEGAGEVEIRTQPQHGALTAQPDGSFTYDPEDHFTGDDSFVYCVHAPGEACAVRPGNAADPTAASSVSTATATITVLPVLVPDDPADPPQRMPDPDPPVVVPKLVGAPILPILPITGAGLWRASVLGAAVVLLGHSYRRLAAVCSPR